MSGASQTPQKTNTLKAFLDKLHQRNKQQKKSNELSFRLCHKRLVRMSLTNDTSTVKFTNALEEGIYLTVPKFHTSEDRKWTEPDNITQNPSSQPHDALQQVWTIGCCPAAASSCGPAPLTWDISKSILKHAWSARNVRGTPGQRGDRAWIIRKGKKRKKITQWPKNVSHKREWKHEN